MSLPLMMKGKVRIPAIGSPMEASGLDLVREQCKAGIVGALPADNSKSPQDLSDVCEELKESLSRWSDRNPKTLVSPFAVNLNSETKYPSNMRHLDVVVRHRVPLVITRGYAGKETFSAVKTYGGEVLQDVTTVKDAETAVGQGATGIVATAADAGGRCGTLSSFALVQEIRKFFKGPLFLSGSVATGNAILAAEALGADGAMVGSAFIAAHEADADEAYKDAVVNEAAGDIVKSSYFTGQEGNFLASSIRRVGYDPDNLPDAKTANNDHAWFGKKAQKAETVWEAGQGIGAVVERSSAKSIVDRLVQEYAEARERLGVNTSLFTKPKFIVKDRLK